MPFVKAILLSCILKSAVNKILARKFLYERKNFTYSDQNKCEMPGIKEEQTA